MWFHNIFSICPRENIDPSKFCVLFESTDLRISPCLRCILGTVITHAHESVEPTESFSIVLLMNVSKCVWKFSMCLKMHSLASRISSIFFTDLGISIENTHDEKCNANLNFFHVSKVWKKYIEYETWQMLYSMQPQKLLFMGSYSKK